MEDRAMMDEPISYRIPKIGDFLIEKDGNIPFEVIEVNHGRVYGMTPAGELVVYPIEHDLHLVDQLDL
jgi:hypothetical protein